MQQTTNPALFARARQVLERIDQKAADLNQLRWLAAQELHQLTDSVDLDTIAAQLARKKVDVVSYITTWAAYGHDDEVRREQTYSGLQRLVRRYPDDPEARRSVIDQARREGISVATVMDHAGYRGQSRISGGGSSHDAEDSLTKQLLALGADSHVQQAWFALDTALHHFAQLHEADAVVPAEVEAMVSERLAQVTHRWGLVKTTGEFARLTQGVE
jgi:hypothetical protein